MTNVDVDQTSDIVGLTGPWYVLSPSAPLNRPIGEVIGSSRLRYTTVRRAYHAVRTRDVGFKAKIIAARSTQDLVAIIPKVPEHPEWALVKERVMLQLLREKFADPSMLSVLLKTGDRTLIHRSETNDLYWGTDSNGQGYNRYGHLLMKLRSEFQRKQQAA